LPKAIEALLLLLRRSSFARRTCLSRAASGRAQP
jgi:hypothetical protein